MAKASIKTKAKTKKKPVKAGSSFKGSYGLPTAKVIAIMKKTKDK
jgi:hypothetical protein